MSLTAAQAENLLCSGASDLSAAVGVLIKTRWHATPQPLVGYAEGQVGLPVRLPCAYTCGCTIDVMIGPGLHAGAWPYAYDPETGDYLGNLRDQDWRCLGDTCDCMPNPILH